jgi:tetrapyrrole methylase family protein/MazG family protein/ATP diphosphatase
MKPIDRLLEIMNRLRDKENGCPWDVEQTFASIANNTLEEAYEVVDSIEKNDMKGLREELGDLLLQVVFHAQMASEQKLFTFDDVAQGICDKLIHRHPHVFADAKIETAAQQTEAWEHLKTEEKKKSGSAPKNLLDNVPIALPGITRALKLQKRAARAGFDWANLEAVFEKLNEETQELLQAMSHKNTSEAILEEIGDMMFCVVNIARKLNVNPEDAIRLCNRKFETRFRHIEAELDIQKRNIGDASLQELNDLWDQAKIAEHSSPIIS